MMNLLDSWINARRRSGKTEIIAPWQMGACDDPVVAIDAPRADFKGALYQFMIGMVQTMFAPDDHAQWKVLWKIPPSPETLKKAFEAYREAFEIDGDGPAFMQDYELPDGEIKKIASLLIEAPGNKTLKDNLAHFIKGGLMEGVDPCWAALALYTLQINAPAGGVGHRVSVRGGGPMTTLILPPEQNEHDTLWHQIWLNILSKEHIEGFTTGPHKEGLEAKFPWLAPTRTSEKNGAETYPEDGHPYQMYWSMPRRIRLQFGFAQPGQCDLSGEPCEHLVTHYRTKNYGVNYMGDWRHPLTPYSVDPVKGALPIKPQPGGIGYRHWLGLVVADEKNQKQPAKVMQIYQDDNRTRVISGDFQPRIWAFGYDMDNMKARCWYEATLPLFYIPKAERAQVQRTTTLMVDAASEAVKTLRNAIKQAWFSRPKDAKGDLSFLDTAFWGATETVFYCLLGESLQSLEQAESTLEPILLAWGKCLRKEAYLLFDHYALSDGNEDGDMKRVVKARNELEKWLYRGKSIKKLAACP